MAEENVVRTNIVATSDMSGLIGDLNKVSLALSQLQERLNATNKGLAVQAAVMNKAFAETLRSTGQFSTHFVSLTSDVDKFGQQLDKGQIKLGQFFRVYGDHVKTSGGVIRDLAKQQVQLQNAILQPLGRNAEGLMQYNVHIPRGLDLVKNKTAIARQELAIMNRVVQEGAGQLINWGKNTQWAGRQLTVGLTIPLAAFGKAAADAFRMADQELVRLTKVYGGLSATTSAELAKVRKDVSATASELARGYGASFKETISLAADIAATGKQGNELLGSVKETTRLAVLGEVDRQEAMKATLAIQTAFKQNTEELSDSINFLNAVENQTSTTLQDLVEAIPKAGPIIKGLGGSVQDLALYMTAMREGGIAAGEGANALKSALGALINPTKVATGMFAGFGIDLKGIVQKNAGDVTATILELQAALDKLDPLQKQQALEQLFGKFQFARMNALFSNLGKQGSQTLQVMDLMKASSQELASVASRELTQVTESASGKYRRALEGLKADLAGVGEQFLKINTALINVISNIVKFAGDLPGPIKSALSFFGMLTAVAGPLIMLTGVLGNFFGYIIKGVFHFKALFKGAEGWKLLTPEILAANKAGSMAEQVFYSDAKAAAILNQALQGLIASYQTLQTHSGSGGIPMPVLPVGGTGREVNPNSPYITKIDTRHFSHMNPVSMMTSAEKSQQSIFGVVPGPQTVNQRISNMPQVYMTEDMPRIQGITSVGKVSTGVIAGEAAKFHALTGALGMQTAPELKKLRTEIARTGLITDELAQSYEALLPKMNDITTNAANRTKQIVAELQENKINADQARARIIALNREIETMMVSAAQQTAAGLGRNINVTQLPLLNQPAFDPRTGKSNMKELFREKRGTRQLLNNIAQVLGVRTFGAGYSIETTRPKKMNVGGYVFTANDGNIVPGPNINADVVPAMLTPGEFVVNAEATRRNLPLLQAINGPGSNGPGYHFGSSKEVRADYSGRELAHLTEMIYTQNLSADKKAKLMNMFGLTYEQVSSPTGRVGSSLFAGYHSFFNQGTNNGNLPLSKAISYLEGKPVLDPKFNAMVTHDPMLAYRPMLMDLGIPKEDMAMFASNMDKKIIEDLKQAQKNGAIFLSDAPISKNQIGTSSIGNSITGYVNSFKNPKLSRNLAKLKLPGEFRMQRPGKSSSARYFPKTTSKASTMIASVVAKKRMPQKLPALLDVFPKLGKTFDMSPIAERRAREAMSSGLFRRNKGGIIPGRTGAGMYSGGGKVPGYNRGGRVAGLLGLNLLSMLGFAGGSTLGGMLGGTPGSFIGGMIGGSLIGGGGGMGGGMRGTGPEARDLRRTAYEKSIFTQTQFGLSLARNVAQGNKFTATLSRIGLGLTKTNIILAGVTTAAVVGYKAWQSYQEKLELTRKSFGLTSESADKLGLKFKDYNSEIKNSLNTLSAIRERGRMTFESLASSGTPLNMTIEQYKKLKEEVKSTMAEQIKMIDVTKKGDLAQLAIQLKEQFVNAGMSAEEASKKIYAAFQLSNKARFTDASTVGNVGFTGITNAQTAAVSSMRTFGLAAASGDAVSQANALNTALGGVDRAISEIQKEWQKSNKTAKEGLTEYEAMKQLQDQINSKVKTQTTLSTELIDELAKQNPEIRNFANQQDTVLSLWQKMRLAASGYTGDLSRAGAEQTNATYRLQQALLKIYTSANASGSLKKQNEELKNYKSQAEKLEKAVKGQSAQQQQAAQDRIQELQKEIDLINKKADARKKALQEEQQDEDIITEIKKKQIEYQEALTTGNMAAAAAAQLDIQALTGQQQRTLAERAIEKRREADIAPRQAEIEKIQDAQNKIGAAATKAAETLDKVSSKYDQLKEKIDGYNLAMANYATAIKEGQKDMSGVSKQLIDAAKALGMDVPYNAGSRGPSAITGKLASFADTAEETAKKFWEKVGANKININTAEVNINADKIKSESPVTKLNVTQGRYLPGGTMTPSTISAQDLAKEKIKAEVGTVFTDASGQKWKIVSKPNAYNQEVNVQKLGMGGMPKHYGPGGDVMGPGTSTSDSIPAYLSNGEYVIRASSVEKYGKEFFDGLNQQRFAKGGYALQEDPNQSFLNKLLFGIKYNAPVRKGEVPFGPSAATVSKMMAAIDKSALEKIGKHANQGWEAIQKSRVDMLSKKYKDADLSDVKKFNELYAKEFYNLSGDDALAIFKGDVTNALTAKSSWDPSKSTYFSRVPDVAAAYSDILRVAKSSKDTGGTILSSQIKIKNLINRLGEGINPMSAQGMGEFPIKMNADNFAEIMSNLKSFSQEEFAALQGFASTGKSMGKWLLDPVLGYSKTFGFAAGGMLSPKYNIPTPSTTMVNPMPMGYNRGGVVNRYDVGGLVLNPPPGTDNREIATMVVSMLESQNLTNMAKTGGRGRLIQ